MDIDFWSQTNSGGPLTRESFMESIKVLERRDAWERWERSHPHGLDSKNPHIVSPSTRARLSREGGYAMCGVCGPFYLPPPNAQ